MLRIFYANPAKLCYIFYEVVLDFNSYMNSSRKLQRQILGLFPEKQVRKLLLDWVNLPQWEGDFAARAARYHRLDLPQAEPAEVYAVDFDVTPGNMQPPPDYGRIVQHYPEVFRHLRNLSVEVARVVGELLRKAWDAPDLRKREWYLADAESYYHRMLGRQGNPTDQPTPMEAVLYYFRRNVEHALYCPNVGCPAPYFLGTKKGQKYCSEVCAAPAQRASKLRWWHKHGSKKAH